MSQPHTWKRQPGLVPPTFLPPQTDESPWFPRRKPADVSYFDLMSVVLLRQQNSMHLPLATGGPFINVTPFI